MRLQLAMKFSRASFSIAAGLCSLALAQVALAGVLPEDRADLLYHRYEGGGVTIDGPSLLVRKSIGENFSGVVKYYVE